MVLATVHPKYIFCFSFVVFGLMPASASEGDCEAFSMAEKGGSMAHVPVRDQGNLGTCYATMVASAVDAWRFSAIPPGDFGFHTSAHAAAIAGKINVTPTKRADENFRIGLMSQAGKSPIDGGVDIDTVVALKKHGVCSYEALEATLETSIFKRDPNNFWTLIKDFYDLYHKQYMTALKDDDGNTLQKILSVAQQDLGSHLCLANFKANQSNLENIHQLRRILLSDDIFEAMKILADKICSGSTIQLPADFPEKPIVFSSSDISEPGAEFNPIAKKTIFHRMISAMLNFKNRQPLMIVYNAGVLLNPSSMETQANHGSLIIGRRRLTDGRCGYLIRNSWGSDGDRMGPGDRVDKNGDILVAEDDLFKSLSRVSVLPPQGEKYNPPVSLYEGIKEIIVGPLQKPYGLGGAGPGGINTKPGNKSR